MVLFIGSLEKAKSGHLPVTFRDRLRGFVRKIWCRWHHQRFAQTLYTSMPSRGNLVYIFYLCFLINPKDATFSSTNSILSIVYAKAVLLL